MEDSSVRIKNFSADGIILGFTGSISSGCSLFARTLSKINKHQYKYYSLSAPIHEIANKMLKEGKVKEITQELLQDIGNDLRKNKGSHYLAKKIFKQIDEDCGSDPFDKVVIDSIRNDWEVKYLRQFPNFFLISVYAKSENRFKRWSLKNPAASLQDFERVDLRDTSEIYEYGQKVEKCTYESDIVINNDKPIEIGNPVAEQTHVKSKLKKYLELIEDGPSIKIRPELDEKLMTLAYVESLSSSCLQRKVGAVISTKDGHVLSTGHNHVPLSEKTCSEQYGDCYRKYLKKLHAEKIVYCPICGSKVEIECPKCNKVIGAYKSKCSSCNTELNFDYECKGCHEKIFDFFTPGGKHSVGKLLDVCRALHAEENAIVNLAKMGGVSNHNKVLYSTTYPCTLCANKIAQVSIKHLVYGEPYTMKEAETILKNSGVTTLKFEGVKSQAFFRLYGY